jgi:hypothetical protein
LAKLTLGKRILAQIKRIFKKRYFNKWTQKNYEARLGQLKREIADKEMKKTYLSRCFYALKDYAIWKQRNSENNMKAIGYFCLKTMSEIFRTWKKNTITEKYERENLAASSAFYRYKLYKKGFIGLKKITTKMMTLRKTREFYEADKILILKHNYLTAWRKAWRNKRKVNTINYYLTVSR